MVWTLILQPESEGPSLISCAASCFKSVLLNHQNLLSAPSWRTVVGVPAESPPAPFQFLVQFIEYEVTQQRIWEPYDYGNLSPGGR